MTDIPEEDTELYSPTDAAALVGCSVQTLRDYEDQGLIKVIRDSRGNRLFTRRVIEQAKKTYEARLAKYGRTGRRKFLVTSTSTTE